MRFCVLLLLASSSYTQAQTAVPTVQGGLLSVRANLAVTLSGSGSSCSGGCLYAWKQTSGNPLLISGSTTASPIVSGVTNGQYTVSLVVKAITGGAVSAPVSLTFGGVGGDSNYVVSQSVSTKVVLQDIIQFNRSPWPMVDSQALVFANYFGPTLSVSCGVGEPPPHCYNPRWLVASSLAGTVTMTNGVAAVSGSGTAFTTNFACNGTDKIVIRYTAGGFTRYQGMGVNSCASATAMVTDQSASDVTTLTSTGYWKLTAAEYFQWGAQSTFNNYYDNVMAYYAQCYRSRITAYCTYAQTLADRVTFNPLWDGGRSSGGSAIASPRLLNLGGIMLRALEVPANWDFITPYLDALAVTLSATSTSTPVVDLRETGYQLMYMAWAAQLHPTGANRTAYLAAVNNAVDRWLVQQQVSGNWIDRNPDTFNGGTQNDAFLTNGSAIVTSAGNKFASYICSTAIGYKPYQIWFADSIDSGDPYGFYCTNNSTNQVTLNATWTGASTNYTYCSPGPTCTKNFQWSNADGRGTIGYMMGIVIRALGHAKQAIGPGAKATSMQATMDLGIAYMGVGGAMYKASAEALYFNRVYPSAELVGGGVSCGGDNECEADYYNRDIQGEIVAAHSFATLSAAVLARGDRIMGQSYASGGGPSTAGGHDAEWAGYNTNPKYWGFFFGIGGAPGWSAARLGGYAGANVVSRNISFGSPSGSTSIEVLTGSSTTATSTACPASPCTVSFDATTGGAYRIVRGAVGGAWINLGGS